jgi:CheY-like chemotaxis protein
MSRSVASHGPLVLIVEDEQMLRMDAAEMIVAAGFEVIEAADADEALRILEGRTDVRALFTDVQMPGSIDGLELAQAVRKRWPPVALIVTSGHSDVSGDALPTGGRFLRKPYREYELAATLRELIDRELVSKPRPP